MSFQDLFSGHANDYLKARPTYPEALFDYLSSLVQQHHAVWDCGTGNGQAAVNLAQFFEQVYATDASEAQINSARARPNIQYQTALAEQSGLPDQSVSLVTVFQALHWFDLEAFYREVYRVLTPKGVFAVVGYHTAIMGIEQIDNVYLDFNNRFLWQKECWAMARDSLNANYANTPFPFEVIQAPAFFITMQWTLYDYLAYLNTWSAVKTYEKKYGSNPVESEVLPNIKDHWPDPDQPREVRFPLVLRVGRRHSSMP